MIEAGRSLRRFEKWQKTFDSPHVNHFSTVMLSFNNTNQDSPYAS